MIEPKYNIFKDPHNRFRRILILENVFPERARSIISKIVTVILIVYGFGVVFPYLVERLPASLPVPENMKLIGREEVAIPSEVGEIRIPSQLIIPEIIPYVGGKVLPLDPQIPKANGILFLILGLWLIFRMLNFYYRSYYYMDEGRLERGQTGSKEPYKMPNFETSVVFYKTKKGDLLKSFLESPQGKKIMARCGIGQETTDKYLKERPKVVDFTDRYGSLRKVFTLRDLVKELVDGDPDFYQFLFGLGIRERELVGATAWVERGTKRRRQNARWWGKVRLGAAQGFGADWAYGGAYLLTKFGQDITQLAVGGGSNFSHLYGSEQIKQLEIILSREKEANAILVGEEGVGKMDVVLDFARDIMNGYTLPTLKDKRVISLDSKVLIANMREKSELETTIIKIFNDAIEAGNVILVLEDLPGFITGGRALDSDVMALIDKYLESVHIQVIATADTSRYHQIIEPNAAIMRRFEKVLLTEPEENSIVNILEQTAEEMERKNHIFYTYPALVEIVKSAENYITEGVMPDKAVDLLVEITPTIQQQGGYLVKKLDVLDFVKEKTNIPVGNISPDEQRKLMELENLLHERVIGQEDAVQIISNAMRRARAGVRSQERPIGSFLFLGPTGVGKTETAKALAAVFFGDEDAMSRIDMSEYQSEDGLMRLIGSFEGGQAGTLTTILRDQPYGVLLLDEFEKTNPKVLDLFLQVFDEGVFHDMMGKKVVARNTIFIATSNAGARLIMETIQRGDNMEGAKQQILDQVIKEGKFKPELLNRFDAAIVFHPLGRPEYREIAILMLKKLQKRLRTQSIELLINDPLIEALLARGVHPEFGARPMARAVQEVVEQRVAEKIISGDLLRGSQIEFSAEELGVVMPAAAEGEPSVVPPSTPPPPPAYGVPPQVEQPPLPEDDRPAPPPQ